jgi:hypothetical protein
MTTTAKPRRDKRHSTKERAIATGLATATCLGLVGLIGFKTLDSAAQASTGASDATTGSATTGASAGASADQLSQYQAQLDQRAIQLQQYQQQLDQYRLQLTQIASALQGEEGGISVPAAPQVAAPAPTRKHKKKAGSSAGAAPAAPAAPRVQAQPAAPQPQYQPQTRSGGSKA